MKTDAVFMRTNGRDRGRHTQTDGGMNLLSQSGAGVGRAGGFVPGRSVGVAHEHMAIFVVAGEPGAAAAPVGRDFVEAENTDENHAHNRGGEKKGLPTRLKCNTLHVRLPAQKTADVRCILAGISAKRHGMKGRF